ncbi:hypothetical protein BDW72DRAFT_2050 [Aspergillus terricola var. indicus]
MNMNPDNLSKFALPVVVFDEGVLLGSVSCLFLVSQNKCINIHGLHDQQGPQENNILMA